MRTALALAVSLIVVVAPAAEARPKATWKGTFSGIGGHAVQGTVRVVRLDDGRRRLVFGGDFSSVDGPALEVWLVPGPVDSSDDVGSRYRSLGALKRLRGRHAYVIGKRTKIAAFDTVVIWCKDFSVAFGSARLKRV